MVAYLKVAVERSHLVRRDCWACLGCWKIRSLTSLPHLLRTIRVHFVPASTALGAHRGKGGRYCVLYIAYMVAPIYGSDQPTHIVSKLAAAKSRPQCRFVSKGGRTESQVICCPTLPSIYGQPIILQGLYVAKMQIRIMQEDRMQRKVASSKEHLVAYRSPTVDASYERNSVSQNYSIGSLKIGDQFSVP